MADYTYGGTPRGEVIREVRTESRKAKKAPATRHSSGRSDCSVPSDKPFPVGTIWQCECGRRWKIQYNPYASDNKVWTKRKWPWPRPKKLTLDEANPPSISASEDSAPALTRKERRELKKIEKSLRD